MAEATTLTVHRCRFVDYRPSAITCISFPPLPLPSLRTDRKKLVAAKPSVKFGTLAVGHANGDIDLCEWTGDGRERQSSQAWVIRKTLSGPHPSKVDSITYVIRYPDDLDADDVPSSSDLRLFSSGGGSDLLEWNTHLGHVRRTINSQGGSIWCMAVNPASTLLALGCEDGTVRLLSVSNDTLTHHRRFDRVKGRLLSIAWGPPIPKRAGKVASGSEDDKDDDIDKWSDAWLVTGCSDSSIRKWDVPSGQILDRMGTDKIRGERTLVWTIGVLGDGTIVSGDSLGIIKFWDARTGTQLQSFQGHGADVLCLTIGPEGNSIFTSGVDQKITQFSSIKSSSAEQTTRSVKHPSNRWIQSCSRRMHSHDVRALATWPPYTPLPSPHHRIFPLDVAPVLASGGLDMSVVVTPVALPSTTIFKAINPLSTSSDCTFEDSYHRRLAYNSGASSSSAIKLARKARLVTCMRNSGLSIWRILTRPRAKEEDCASLDTHINAGGWEKVLDMNLNVHTNLVASAISDDGRWLVASDMYETKLFKLTADTKGRLTPCRIRDLPSLLRAHCGSSSTGGLAFQFAPDNSKLVMSTSMSSHILVIDLTGDMPRVLRRFDHHRLKDSRSRDSVRKGPASGGDDLVMQDATVEPHRVGYENEGDIKPSIANVIQIAISSDGQWLATSDDCARTHIFNLDSIQHHSVLPSFSKPVHVLSFDVNRPNILVVAFPDNSLQIYDVESQQFPAWGKEICNNLPRRFRHSHDPVLGVAFRSADISPTAGEAPVCAVFWSSTWICKLPLKNATITGSNRKRGRESVKLLDTPPGKDDDNINDFKMITHYRPILLVGFLDEGELVVVERPLVDVLSELPPAYFRHKYGAT